MSEPQGQQWSEPQGQQWSEPQGQHWPKPQGDHWSVSAWQQQLAWDDQAWQADTWEARDDDRWTEGRREGGGRRR